MKIPLRSSERGPLTAAILQPYRRIFFLLVFFSLLLLATLLLSRPAGARTERGAAVETMAADFSLPTKSGNVALGSLRGKVVLIDFWASWCGPCRQSFPWLRSMASKHAPEGFVVVAINLDKDREAANEFLRDFKPSFDVAFDPAGRTAEAYDVRAMPSSYLVGRDGRLVYSHAGFTLRDEETIENKIKEAVAK